jgi:hypothetical protein
MGIGDKTALSARLNDPATWKGTDDDVWYMRWRIRIKAWFAFSHRSPEGIAFSFVFFPLTYLMPFTIWFTGWSWWYLFPSIVIPVTRKWRMKPKVLWGKKWGGYWRWESVGNLPDGSTATDDPRNFDSMETDFYLSRIQPWTRGAIIIFWPLCGVVHFFPKKEDVGTPDRLMHRRESEWYFYRGWHFDDDLTFWGDGAAGPNFK